MTHTYSRGCFKLIFRKCLPYTPPALRAHAGTHIRTFFIVIARLLALSHHRTTLQHLYPYAPSPFRSVFRIPMLFPSYFPSFSSYPFSSTSSSFTPSHILLVIHSHLRRSRFSFSSSHIILFILYFLYVSFPFNYIFSSFIFMHFPFFSSLHFIAFFFSFSLTSISSFLSLITLSLPLLFNFIFHSPIFFFSCLLLLFDIAFFISSPFSSHSFFLSYFPLPPQLFLLTFP